jgi:kanamycin kinase
MRRRLIEEPELERYPEQLRSLMEGSQLYSAKFSKYSNVIYIDRDGGYFLKATPPGRLQREAEMTRFFHEKGLAAEVLDYIPAENQEWDRQKWDEAMTCFYPFRDPADQDWLLTRSVPGEDCTDRSLLDAPEVLCDRLAEVLRILHSTNPVGYPGEALTPRYLEQITRSHDAGRYDTSIYIGMPPPPFGTKEEAWAIVEKNRDYLKSDVLIHGDFCLPNVLFQNGRFSGLIDLGNAGLGDRHMDLFWTIWSLCFNLGTDRYTDRFLDAYGRDKVEPELLRTIAAAELFW